MPHSKITKPKAIVIAGYGLNCEDETAFAFGRAGARADIVHINDLIGSSGRTAGARSGATAKLRNYQILAIPGGFSFGDDLGSGKAYAAKLKQYLGEQLNEFISRDTLTIGICNGFQILTNMGLLPGALTFNQTGRHIDRWVDVAIEGKGPWLAGITNLMLPIAHGEGRYFADEKELGKLKLQGAVAGRYVSGEICKLFDLPPNPNGSLESIAGVTSHDGRILGMMPHPERAQFSYQMPHWTLKEAGGLQIFINSVEYFTN